MSRKRRVLVAALKAKVALAAIGLAVGCCAAQLNSGSVSNLQAIMFPV